MVNRRRTKKYNRRKSSRSSLRRSLRKSLKRKNSKRKSRIKKRTRKIKQRGGTNLGEVLRNINYQRAGEVCNLHIQFNTDDFQVGEMKMGNMEMIGKLLIFKGTKGTKSFFHNEIFDTIHAGNVYFDAKTKTIHIVFRISNDGNTNTFHKSFRVKNNSVALRQKYLVSQSKGEYNEELCILYIRSEGGNVEEFPILIDNDEKMVRFIASMNNVDMSAPLVCSLTGIKTKTEQGTVRSVSLDSGMNLLMMNPKIDASDYFLRLNVEGGQDVEFKLEEIETFDWAAGRGLGSRNPGLRITLTKSKQIDSDEVIDIKFTFEEPNEFVKLFMVEKGKQMIEQAGAKAKAKADPQVTNAEPELDDDGL